MDRSPPFRRTRSGGWPILLLTLSILSATRFAMEAFGSPDTIQDDARQFLAWTPRLLDPLALRGDLIADYWWSASPPLFRRVYEALSAIGVTPLALSHLLPLALLPATAMLAWWVASRLCDRPGVAFLSAATMMAIEVQTDSIFTGTPRGFMAPLFLLVLGGVARANSVAIVAGLGLLAAFYPAAAVVAFTIVGLSRIRLAPRPAIDLSTRSVALVGLSAVIVLAPMLLFKGEIERWQPILTMAEAHRLPNFDQPSLGPAAVDPGAAFGWACSSRMGFLPRVAHCHGSTDVAALLDLLFLAPAILLAGRAVRRPADPALIYGWVLLASLLWFAIAALVAFKLHLPSRYSQHELAIAGGLAFGQVIGKEICDGGRWRRWLAIPMAAALLACFALPSAKLKTPADRAAIARLAAMPRDTRIAGVSEDLNFVPALTGRSVLATTEHAIPYHLAYFRPLRSRMAATVDAVTTGDPAVLRAFVQRYRVDVLAVDRATLATNRVDDRYALTIPETMAAVALRPAPSALARLAPACLLKGGNTLVLIDARCLLRPAVGSGASMPSVDSRDGQA